MAGIGTAHLRERDDIVLRVEHLSVSFRVGRNATVQAVSDVSLDIAKGETLGLVGESGCGKSTTGRAIMQLPPPGSGSVSFQGTDLTTLRGRDLRRTRARLQMILQDPISSLNPRRRVRDIVGEGLRIWDRDGDIDDRVQRALLDVGLDPDVVADRRPHQFSGGQCQRICLARSLVLDPDVVICDEPVSALDVSVQAQILNLLEAMKHRYELTMLFIAHDLAVVKNISDRIVVMYLGRVCEVAPSDDLYVRPAHPYTRALLESIPRPEPGAPDNGSGADGTDDAEMPSALDPPSGCRFRTRCPRADEQCSSEVPTLTAMGTDHFVACHHPHLDIWEGAVSVAAGANGVEPDAPDRDTLNSPWSADGRPSDASHIDDIDLQPITIASVISSTPGQPDPSQIPSTSTNTTS